MVVGSYLMTGQGPAPNTLKPTDAAGPVLDVLESYGADGVDIPSLISATGFDEKFLREVLTYLERNSMAVPNDRGGYTLTPLGARAKYLVAR